MARAAKMPALDKIIGKDGAKPKPSRKPRSWQSQLASWGKFTARSPKGR